MQGNKEDTIHENEEIESKFKAFDTVLLALIILATTFVLSLSSPFSFLTPPSSIWTTTLLFTATVIFVLATVAISHILSMLGRAGGGSLTTALVATVILAILVIPQLGMSVFGMGIFSDMSPDKNQAATFWLSIPILAVLLSIGSMMIVSKIDSFTGGSEEATATA